MARCRSCWTCSERSPGAKRNGDVDDARKSQARLWRCPGASWLLCSGRQCGAQLKSTADRHSVTTGEDGRALRFFDRFALESLERRGYPRGVKPRWLNHTFRLILGCAFVGGFALGAKAQDRTQAR